MMKKGSKSVKAVVFFKVAAILAAVLLFAACSKKGADGVSSPTDKESASAEKKGENIKVVSVSYSGFDWAKALTEGLENYEIKYLLEKGGDPHSFKPSVEDIRALAEADVVVFAGGEADEWVDKALEENPKRRKVVNMLSVIGNTYLEEEIKEGMQKPEHSHNDSDKGEHEHDKDHNHDHDDDHDHETELDEHVWLSLKRAKTIIEKIESAVVSFDPKNAEAIGRNADAYLEKLTALDRAYTEMADNAKLKTLIFGDRFPFRYLLNDYGLDYYAAFVGCSAETEASFQTVAFLAEKVKELKVPVVFTIEHSSKKIAQSVIDTAKVSAKVSELNSLQSVTDEDISSGINYLSAMEKNLEEIRKALGD